ncbi:hypothetical protein [Mariniblastus fucicola]|uniref:Uncharacterized protein n=1 Tax=Mariniblastus fucicola TaxID=980251 RepID=A0A5B9P5L9_9BACT|nr:hypothetical protein [Mariniblastus fucicola]QEG20272.1 hypothetical protein MFFC18_01190 [Mariniblastus fucicola]
MTETAHATHDHADDHSSGGHGKNRYDDIPVGSVLYYGAIAVICTLLSFLFVKGLLNAMTASFEAKRQSQIVETPANLEVDKQKKLLEGGAGTISIEEASKKVLEQYGSH